MTRLPALFTVTDEGLRLSMNQVIESDGVPCMLMRGGTSKGAFFVRDDLPTETRSRDRFLLRVMGSPDLRQIDGIGGADPLTSKVAIVSASSRPGIDIDYLFLQVSVDRAQVSDAQNCGNILSGVVQFALERKLLEPSAEIAGHQQTFNVYMENSDQIANVTVMIEKGRPIYQGEARIDGVPGTAAPVLQNFPQAAGSNCGSLLPTGDQLNTLAGVEVTMIDNGMPVVLLRAQDMGISGQETRVQLDVDDGLKNRLEKIRLLAGPLMNLGDVSEQTVPKMTMVSAPVNGGAINTRTFIPHRCHASIGVLGAVSVATAALLPQSVAHSLAHIPTADSSGNRSISVEHPIGETSVLVNLNEGDGKVQVGQAAILRTARKLFDGRVFV